MLFRSTLLSIVTKIFMGWKMGQYIIQSGASNVSYTELFHSTIWWLYFGMMILLEMFSLLKYENLRYFVQTIVKLCIDSSKPNLIDSSIPNLACLFDSDYRVLFLSCLEHSQKETNCLTLIFTVALAGMVILFWFGEWIMIQNGMVWQAFTSEHMSVNILTLVYFFWFLSFEIFTAIIHLVMIQFYLAVSAKVLEQMTARYVIYAVVYQNQIFIPFNFQLSRN